MVLSASVCVQLMNNLQVSLGGGEFVFLFSLFFPMTQNMCMWNMSLTQRTCPVGSLRQGATAKELEQHRMDPDHKGWSCPVGAPGSPSAVISPAVINLIQCMQPTSENIISIWGEGKSTHSIVTPAV